MRSPEAQAQIFVLISRVHYCIVSFQCVIAQCGILSGWVTVKELHVSYHNKDIQ